MDDKDTYVMKLKCHLQSNSSNYSSNYWIGNQMAVKFGHIVHAENFLKVICISGKALEGSICWFLSKSPKNP